MKQLRFKFYIVCVNELPMVDLNQFIGNAKFAKFAFCAFSRPKYLYQVGFYRIGGHLVFIWNLSIVYG